MEKREALLCTFSIRFAGIDVLDVKLGLHLRVEGARKEALGLVLMEEAAAISIA